MLVAPIPVRAERAGSSHANDLNRSPFDHPSTTLLEPPAFQADEGHPETSPFVLTFCLGKTSRGYPGGSAASMRSAQKPASMQRSFQREKGRLAANGALWVIRKQVAQVISLSGTDEGHPEKKPTVCRFNLEPSVASCKFMHHLGPGPCAWILLSQRLKAEKPIKKCLAFIAGQETGWGSFVCRGSAARSRWFSGIVLNVSRCPEVQTGA